MKRTRRMWSFSRFVCSRTMKLLTLTLAGASVFQATGCFPDPLGALNFQLQFLVNTVVLDIISVVIQNIFRL
jgi:hypothetical protein